MATTGDRVRDALDEWADERFIEAQLGIPRQRTADDAGDTDNP